MAGKAGAMSYPRLARPGYKAVHERLKRDKGPAAEWSCAHCSLPAANWAYVGGDPDELFEKRAYSTNLDSYIPLCHKCHVAFDRSARPWLNLDPNFCIRGHSAWRLNKKGGRYCRECMKINNAKARSVR